MPVKLQIIVHCNPVHVPIVSSNKNDQRIDHIGLVRAGLGFGGTALALPIALLVVESDQVVVGRSI